MGRLARLETFVDSSLRLDRIVDLERWYPIVQQIGGRSRRLDHVKLGKIRFREGVDEGLPLAPTNIFQCADVEDILGAQIARMGRLNLAISLTVLLFSSAAS